MEAFETSPNQITIFYNPGNTTQEKAVAHAKGTGKEVLAIAYKDAPSAYNVWTKIWDQLPFPKNEFFDKEDPNFDKLVGDREFSFNDWRNICIHNPNMIGAAVAISGDKVTVLNRQTEVYRLQELGPDAAEQRIPEDSNIAEANKAHNEVDELGMKLNR